MDAAHIFHGALIHSLTPDSIEILERALLVVDHNGRITHLDKDVPVSELSSRLDELGVTVLAASTATSATTTTATLVGSNADTTATTRPPTQHHILPRGQFLIPGFVDTHNHAPQWAQRGLGRGMQILDWLREITFRNEARFKDVEYARRIYMSLVSGMLQQGVTTASYYGSIHTPATKLLAEVCLEKGQRALIGKCNMDRNGADFYEDESAEQSIRETRDLIAHIKTLDPRGEMVRPILTPRFAICCTEPLLKGLGEIAKEEADDDDDDDDTNQTGEEQEKGEKRARPKQKHKDKGTMIQTHFNEAASEISATLSLFPQFKDEVELYESFGLLGPHTVLAHCTVMRADEITRLAERGCGVAHCPVANTTVGGGFMAAPVREFLRHGMNVGLGTDSGGGFSSSILDAMRQAFIVSNAREMLTHGSDPSLSVEECFYLATLGGATVCGLGGKVGSFEIGKEFDALHVIATATAAETDADADAGAERRRRGVMTLVEDEDSLRTIWEKFLMSGDDRNIQRTFVKGREVNG